MLRLRRARVGRTAISASSVVRSLRRRSSAGDAPTAGDGLLHPIVLAAIALLVINDQALKRVWPGVVTGKLSDVAGLVFAPLLLVAAAELVASARGRWTGPRTRPVTIAVAAVGLGFAAVKLIPEAEAAWELALGVVQWPVSALADLTAGRGPAPVRSVVSTPDATDLVALPAIWLAHAIGLGRVRRAQTRDGDATQALGGAWWYELGVSVLTVTMLAGAILDGWSHVHDPASLETVLTPSHAVVYVSFALVALLVFAPLLAARLEGRDPIRAVPLGFGWSVVGVVAFGVTGLLDLGWHLLFGLEADTEALLSPTHLGLGATSALIASGPVRAAWLRRDDVRRPAAATWPRFLPALLAVVTIAGVAAFALHPVNLFVDAWPRWPYGRYDATWYAPNLGVAGAIVPTVILFTALLELLRRWPSLPAGTATVLFGGTIAGLTFLHDNQVLVGAPVLGGVLVDLVLLGIPGGPASRRWLVAGLGPALVFAACFVVLSRTGPVAWSAHLIGGTVAIAALTGLTLALLARQPPVPASGD